LCGCVDPEPCSTAHERVAGVSTERLVTSVAVQRHRDVPATQSGHVERWNSGRVGEWLVEIPGEGRQDVQRGGADDELVVVGPVLARHRPGVFPFVEPGVVEADGECFHRPLGDPGHGGHDGGGIDTAGQERAQRPLGHHADPGGFEQEFTGAFGCFRLTGHLGRREVERPVAPYAHPAVLPGQEMPGWQFADSAEN